jgi:hypothetical protein
LIRLLEKIKIKLGEIIMKKSFYILVLLLIAESAVFGAATFSQLDTSLVDSGNATASFVSSARWVFAIVPLVMGGMGALWMWNDTHKHAEMGQENTKISKVFKPVMGFALGILASFIVYGILGTTFLTQANAGNAGNAGNGDAGATFTSTWKILVTDWWTAALTGKAYTGAVGAPIK